jgi:hypothetical protein
MLVAKAGVVGPGDFELPLSNEQSVIRLLYIARSLDRHSRLCSRHGFIRPRNVDDLVKLEQRSNWLRCRYGNQSLILAGEWQPACYCSPNYRALYGDLFAHEFVEVEV